MRAHEPAARWRPEVMRRLVGWIFVVLAACQPADADADAAGAAQHQTEGQAPSPSGEHEALSARKRKVDASAAKNLAAGGQIGFVVGVVDGKESAVWSYGETVLGSKRSPSADTLYDLASVTKVMTGTLLGLEIARRRVTLEDTLSTYWPELRGLPAGKITRLRATAACAIRSRTSISTSSRARGW
jgi:CubicO group peptidase (beta-lactamase class C family)